MKTLMFVVSTPSGYAAVRPPAQMLVLLSGKNFATLDEVLEWGRENGIDAYRELGPRTEIEPKPKAKREAPAKRKATK